MMLSMFSVENIFPQVLPQVRMGLLEVGLAENLPTRRSDRRSMFCQSPDPSQRVVRLSVSPCAVPDWTRSDLPTVSVTAVLVVVAAEAKPPTSWPVLVRQCSHDNDDVLVMLRCC